MTITNPPLFFALVFCGLLLGCSTTDTATPQPAVSPAAPVAQPEPSKPFDTETLYSLLAAEFAGNRRQYDLALSNYAQQARQTRDPQIAERATLLARYLGNTNTAVETAQIWMDSAPDNRDALTNNALAHLEAGKIQEAFNLSQRLMKEGNEPLFQLIAARAASLSEKDHHQLLAAYQELLQQDPRNEQLLIGTGLLLEQQGNYEQAMQMAHQTLKYYPQSMAAAVLEANLLHQMKRDTEALAKMADLLSLYPDNTRLRQQYARILSSTDLAQAQQQFTLLAQQVPHNGDIWLSLGIVALQRQDKKAASGAFETLLDLNQHLSTAHFYLGQIAEEDDRLGEATLHYLQVSEGNDFLSATVKLLDILIRQKDLESAQQHVNRLCLNYPEQAPVLAMLHSETLHKYQQDKAAQATLDQALKSHPDHIQLLYARAMLSDQLKQLPKAERDLRQILQLEPENSQALNALGYLLADRTDRLDEARPLITKALALSPDEPAILDSMGWLEFRSGNFPRAIEWLQRAFIMSNDAEIGAHLGEALWLNNQQEEARSIWQKALHSPRGQTNTVLRNTLQRFKVNF